MNMERTPHLPPSWTEEDVEANGMRIHYYRAGANAGNAPPVILLHGATDNGLCFLRAAMLLEKKFDVIMPDARGHGRSDAPGRGYEYSQLAADGIAFLNIMKIDRPVLIGHSMGAETAAIIASQLKEQIRGAILEDPPWFTKGGGTNSRRRRFDPDEWQRGIAEQKTRPVEELERECRLANPHWEEEDIGPWAFSKRQVDPTITGIFLTSPPWVETVGGVTCPVLLFTGDNEKGSLVSPATAEMVQSLGKSVTVRHVSGAGHNIRRDGFRDYFREVEAFLGSLKT